MTNRTAVIGDGVTCDIGRLVASRLMVQANSGAGKTRTLRRLLEQTHGAVQHLVIDPEGEYHTLRERFDYVLAAPSGGDTAAHPRTAALLAERLLQLGVSAILDIYELNPDQRQAFVRAFVGALVDAPRSLWHPALVVLDEAHVFAPEGSESESAAAVKALASRGRKRGFALVAATQRLSKLSKDVAAECTNKLVGRCVQDVDMKRAAEELGFATREQRFGLRLLEPGQFYAFGPAFGVVEPTLVRVGPSVTSHPEAGAQASPAAPPTAKIRGLLPKLADLPAEAEERATTIEGLRKENAQLRRQVTEAQRGQPPPKPVTVEKPVLTDAHLDRVERLVDRAERAVAKAQDGLTRPLADVRAAVGELVAAVRTVRQPALPLKHPAVHWRLKPEDLERDPLDVARERRASEKSGAVEGRPEPMRRILQSLGWWASMGIDRPTRTQVAFMARYTVNGHFNNTLGAMVTEGLITYPVPGTVGLTPTGAAEAPAPADVPSFEAMVDAVRQVLRDEPLQRVFTAMLRCLPVVDREALAAACEPAYTVNGHFNNTLGTLRSLGVIAYPTKGMVGLGPMFAPFLGGDR